MVVEQGGLTRENGQRFREAILPEVTAKIWNACIDNGAVRLLDYADAATSWLEHINTTNGWLEISPGQPGYSSNCSSWTRATSPLKLIPFRSRQQNA